MTAFPDVPPGVDPTRPSSVRLYDYFLGGTHNYPVDREVAERLKATVPDIVDAMLANRGFQGRAATWIARQGVRQFIDIGAGLPTRNNTHEAVRRVLPEARVVYVDHDPMVAAYSGPLLGADGTTTLVTADWRDPGAVLGNPGAAAAHRSRASGRTSVLAGRAALANVAEGVHLRSKAEVERFFDGLELVPPYTGADGVMTYAGLWGAEDIEAADTEGSRGIYCGVARRP